jgi:hypothetical protein
MAYINEIIDGIIVGKQFGQTINSFQLKPIEIKFIGVEFSEY